MPVRSKSFIKSSSWTLFFNRLGPTSKVPGSNNAIRGGESIWKMRKSPWIGFKMNWRNQSHWVEYWVEYDQKANIEAGESVADDEAKYGRVKGPSHIFHKKF
ncbi:Uncharacterized protein Rs2_43230 [Raphanus sativus]|nr:Uncharacterized protein Rs2_43230 [Raphanus sativus]